MEWVKISPIAYEKITVFCKNYSVKGSEKSKKLKTSCLKTKMKTP